MNNNHIFLDTGILKNILKKNEQERSDRFQHDLVKLFGNNMYFCSSPKLLLEVLGFKISLPEKLEVETLHPILLKEEKLVSLNIGKCFNILVKNLNKSPLFTLDNIIERFNNELRYRSSFGKELLQAIFESNLTHGKHKQFLQMLAIEQIQQIKLHDFIKSQDLLARTQIQIFRNLRDFYFEGTTMSLSRNVSETIEFISSTEPGKTFITTYQKDSQFVDSDIVHISLLGMMINKKRTNVSILSTEKLANWKVRVLKYMSMINFLNSQDFKDKKKVEYYFGKIYQVDSNSGEILKDHLCLKSLYNKEVKK